MPFVSYAQNFEDVMLYRALKDVSSGFYIDVGANHPIDHSVTKAFYDRGWSGINIEPSDAAFAAIERERARDINLKVACWNEAGTRTIYQIEGIEAWATLAPSMVANHKAEGRAIFEKIIETTTLKSVCEQYVGSAPIHFLKIDVEGGEMAVLAGADPLRWRPWIIVAEAHGPDFSVKHHQPLETNLASVGYRFVYCDGLNRFYVADEHAERLSPAFERPPNVYDDFVLASEVRLLERAEFAERTRAAAWEALEVAQEAARRFERELNELRAMQNQVG
jgi:FkbM family methyltransferase